MQRSTNKHLNERMDAIDKDFRDQLHRKSEHFDNQHRMTYETLTQLKEKSEADIEKIRQIEVTLQDQVDIIHAMNEKLSVQAENLRQGDNELNRRLVEAERKIIDIQGAERSAAERSEI